MRYKHSQSGGFTLVEALVGAALFVTVALAAYNAYIGLFKLVDLSQYRVLAAALANEQFEIARNMPYDSVGVQGSIPNGVIPHVQVLERGGVSFTVTTIVRNIDLPFDGTIGGSPNDTSPSDNKLIEVEVSCSACRGMTPLTITGQIAPKNLETASTNGALFVRVFDANGQPVKDADVHVVNVATTSTIVIDDVTDANGMLQLVDVPPGVNAYRISVSKSGYSSDRTYPLDDPSNPNPEKPDATVLVQQVTQVSFAIDKLGSLSISSVTPTCTAVNSINFSLTGSKTLGIGIPKYDKEFATDGSGRLLLPSMEWGTYTLAPLDTDYDLVGINPLNPVVINAGGDAEVQLIVGSKDPSTLLVTVKDAVTQLPLSDAIVMLSKSGYSSTVTTGRGYLAQSDWAGGAGQDDFTDAAEYFSDNGNIDATTQPGQVILRNDGFGSYNPAGFLESSTFDTGSASNFYSLIWGPTDQPAAVGSESVRMQFATNETLTATTTWDFLGPDGTSGTYYTSPNSALSAVHNGGRYARYRLYLSTESLTATPNVSDVSFTFTSDCVPPGQVAFSGLSAGTYTLEVGKSGYSTSTASVTVSGDWQEQQVLMAP